MLTETVLLGSSRVPTDGVDAPSICTYDIHSHSLLTSFKRSQTSPHCLATTSTHIFAGQSDKAVINVYSLTKGALETTIPLPERPSVITASPCSSFLAFGTPSGRVYVWELASGRFVATPQTHLQTVTTLLFSATTTLLISGSADSNLHVWSLPHLLDIQDPPRKPVHTLTRHAHPITATVISRATCGGPADLLVSASEDSVIAWNPHTGEHLRTYIPLSPPTSLALDPADRAVYIGAVDGSLSTIDIHNPLQPQTAVYAREFRDVPITLPAEARWGDVGAEVRTMAVSYEGNMVVTGDSQGVVKLWDVATGRLWKVLAEMKAPVDSLLMNNPGKKDEEKTKVLVLPKGRYETVLAATSTRTYDPHQYGVTTTLVGAVGKRRSTMGKERDLGMIAQGAKEMARFGGVLAKGQKVEQLQQELAAMYEQYERLRAVQGKTWEALVERTVEQKE